MGLGYLIIWLILLIIIITISILVFKAILKKKYFISIIALGILCAIFLWIADTSGTFTSTGVKSGKLYIVYSGTGSMGSSASYDIIEDGILKEDGKIYKGGLSMEMKFGWRFKAIKPGTCQIKVNVYSCGDISDIHIYNVTVDQNLDITYELE